MKRFSLILFSLALSSLPLSAQVLSANSSDDDSNNIVLTPQSENVQIAMSVPDYLVTAGDIYTLAFVIGTEAITYSLPVDSTYRIRVANLGVIDASGKTFVELKRQVENLVSKNYPMSGVQFVLTKGGRIQSHHKRRSGFHY